MNASGIEILPVLPCIDDALTARFRHLATSVVSDSMGRLPGSCNLRAYHGTRALVGTALTVVVRSGDNLLIHNALDLALPGHVLIIDGGADVSRALVGELMMLYARSRGVTGFVVDGAIRDVARFRAHDFPCFARGASHRGPYKDGPGRINVPICIDGMVVNPGDLVFADEDGVVCVPRDAVEGVLAAAERKQSDEQRTIEAISNGTSDREWINKALTSKFNFHQ
jgi:RraA family protein